MHHDHTHVNGLWNLIKVQDKSLAEPFEFTFNPKSVSFSYGNGYVFDFEIHNDKFKWANHIKTDLTHPTPHQPSEADVIEALKSVSTFKEEHNNLHLLDERGKEVMLFHKK